MVHLTVHKVRVVQGSASAPCTTGDQQMVSVDKMQLKRGKRRAKEKEDKRKLKTFREFYRVLIAIRVGGCSTAPALRSSRVLDMSWRWSQACVGGLRPDVAAQLHQANSSNVTSGIGWAASSLQRRAAVVGITAAADQGSSACTAFAVT